MADYVPTVKPSTSLAKNSSCNVQLSELPSLGLLSRMLPDESIKKHRSTFVSHTVQKQRINVFIAGVRYRLDHENLPEFWLS